MLYVDYLPLMSYLLIINYLIRGVWGYFHDGSRLKNNQ